MEHVIDRIKQPCKMCDKVKGIYIGIDNKPVAVNFCPFCGRQLDKTGAVDGAIDIIDSTIAGE